MKKLKMALAIIGTLLCLQPGSVAAQSNLILNPSFEVGTHPTGDNAFKMGNVTNWGAGYTRNTPHGTALGGTPDLLDYNPVTPCNSYGPIPNGYISSNTGPGSLPQHGKRFALIHGGYTGQYQYLEGESIMGELHKFSCPGEYTFSFWAKAPDGFWQGNCSGYFGFTSYSIHSNNYIQVLLRNAANNTVGRQIYATPTPIAKGNWVQYSTTVSITASDIASFDRIEFRLDSAGAQGSYKKISFIDNVSLKYNGPATTPTIHYFTDTISCIDSLDLDLVNTKICDGYYDSWTLNGTPVSNIVNPKVNSSYITSCRSCDGCINFIVQVDVTVTEPGVDTIDTFLCIDNKDIAPPVRCPLANSSSVEWKDPDGNFISPLNPEGKITANVPGVYEVTVNYNNGCACKTVLNVNISDLYPLDVLYDTLRCDSCIQLSSASCPPGSITGMWSHSLGTNPGVTVCPAQSEIYVYTCSDIHGCPTYKSERHITYQPTTPSYIINLSQVAVCGQTAAKVPISCNNGIPYTDGTYKWYDDFGNFIIETSTPELPYQVSGQGKYHVHIYDKHGCLMCTETFDIKWFNNQRGYFIDTDTLKLCPGDCATLFFDYGGSGLLTSSGVTVLPFSWSLPGAPVMGTDIVDNGNGTFTFCPPALPVTLKRVFLDANNPLCTLYHQEIVIVQDVDCGDMGPMMKTLGADDVNTEDAITIYPNPVSGTFTLTVAGMDLTGATYSVTDMSGKIVIEQTKATTEKLTINLGQHTKGVYMVKIHTNDMVLTKKVLLQ